MLEHIMTSDTQAGALSLLTSTIMSKRSVEPSLRACHELTQVPMLPRRQPAPQVYPGPRFNLFSSRRAFPPSCPQLIFGIRITRLCPAPTPIAVDRPAR